VFEELGCSVEWKQAEGVMLDPGETGRVVVATVTGAVSAPTTPLAAQLCRTFFFYDEVILRSSVSVTLNG
jgi:hypothetical protein